MRDPPRHCSRHRVCSINERHHGVTGIRQQSGAQAVRRPRNFVRRSSLEVPMARQACLGFVVLLAMSISAAGVLQAAQAGSAEAMAAAKASPELVGALSKEIGSTPEQAAGAAG